jgi:inosine/xanthosine triphosphate pyrophosphatase family protein
MAELMAIFFINSQEKNGFGYDPLFYVDELGKSMAQLTAGPKESN